MSQLWLGSGNHKHSIEIEDDETKLLCLCSGYHASPSADTLGSVKGILKVCELDSALLNVDRTGFAGCRCIICDVNPSAGNCHSVWACSALTTTQPMACCKPTLYAISHRCLSSVTCSATMVWSSHFLDHTGGRTQAVDLADWYPCMHLGWLCFNKGMSMWSSAQTAGRTIVP